MSSEMALAYPASRATKAAPDTPAAGPESTVLTGRPTTASTLISPPSDRTTASAGVRPLSCRRRSMPRTVRSMTGMT